MTGADLGIAWDGDADRCFFIDGEGSFCDGDFICALLARSILQKNPGATILYDPRSSRAVPDLVAAEGGRSDLSRVGHAFFKARMREEEAAFGGEVSGHYYFRDFWNADSGTIPALLVLELLSLDGRTLAELMEEFRSRYFISGEINSEVADQEAKMAEIAERYCGRRDHPPRRDLGRLPRLALQRAPLEHRAAAAAQPRVADLARGHGAAARRDPRADPGVTATPEQALEQAALAGIHRFPIPTPFAVGRVNCYLIEDEPLTLVDTGPNSGKALDELIARLAERGHELSDLELIVVTHQHIDHLGLVEILVEHSGAEVAALGAAADRLAAFDEDAEAGGQVRGRGDAAQRHPRGRDGGAAQRLPQLPRLGLARDGDATAGGRRHAGAARPAPRGPPPPRPQPLRHGLLGRGAPDPDRRRPPARRRSPPTR